MFVYFVLVAKYSTVPKLDIYSRSCHSSTVLVIIKVPQSEGKRGELSQILYYFKKLISAS